MLGLIMITVIFSTSDALADTIHVDDDAVCPGSGTEAEPYCSIQDAIDATTNGCTVLVHDGTYYENITFDGSKTITVQSENGPDVTVINGDNNDDCESADSVVSFTGGNNSTLNSFTITGGTGKEHVPGVFAGGGIYCLNSSPTISGCIIRDNKVLSVCLWVEGAGGGIYCSFSSPTITDCTIKNNDAGFEGRGGGIYFENASATITNCTIKDNNSTFGGGGIYGSDSECIINDCHILENGTGYDASTGGGICLSNSSAKITYSTISKNGASGSTTSGAGISWSGNTLFMNHCTITENNGSIDWGFGGGICSYGESIRITNCIISGNRLNGKGGGIYLSSGMASIENCTITGNEVYGEGSSWGAGEWGVGGGIYFNKSISPRIINCTISGNLARLGGSVYCYDESSPLVVNSILWGNEAEENYHEIYLGPGIDAEINYSDFNPSYIGGDGIWSGSNNINADPLFVDPRPASEAPTIAGDYHLLSGSPCIDTGTDDIVMYPDLPPNDIDGDDRPQGVSYDVGSDEYVTWCEMSTYDVPSRMLHIPLVKVGNNCYEANLKKTVVGWYFNLQSFTSVPCL
jgi:parallel beta-helix repeat protein